MKSKSKTKKTTTAKGSAASPRSATKRAHGGPLARAGATTLSLGRECREQIRFLAGRHVMLDGRRATSGSAAVRDLVQRAYAALGRRK